MVHGPKMKLVIYSYRTTNYNNDEPCNEENKSTTAPFTMIIDDIYQWQHAINICIIIKFDLPIFPLFILQTINHADFRKDTHWKDYHA